MEDSLRLLSDGSIQAAIGDSSASGIEDALLALLRDPSKDAIVKSASAIAEIAKTDDGREKCTSAKFVEALVDLLRDDRVEVLTQACTALGNICYKNENGKQLLEDKGGLKAVLAMLQRSVVLEDNDAASNLRNVAAGFLVNFLVDRTSLQKEAVQQGAVQILCDLMEADGTKEGGVAQRALLVLGILNDSGDVFLDERLTKILVNILASDPSPELLEVTLELLLGQVEEDNTKVLLAKAGVCELLLKRIEKDSPNTNDEERRSCLKDACNLIVLILNGDESTSILYDNGNGEVYRKLASWLHMDDKDLQVTAMVAMGNFACTDERSKAMVGQGVYRSLLKLYRTKDCGTDDMEFQYAFLGALRNLVIAADNKKTMLDDGLLDVLHPMLDVSAFPVVFKLLGTLRIVIGKQRQAAIDLAKMDGVIKRVVEWCGTEGHYGVQWEAKRLIAWLINNSRDRDVCLLMVEHSALKPLVSMLTAQQPLMQNEALISLTILSTVCLPEAEKHLLEAELGRNLSKLVENGTETLELPVLHNVVSFLCSIATSKLLRDHLREAEVPSHCQKLLQAKESETGFAEKLRGVCEQLNSSTIKN